MFLSFLSCSLFSYAANPRAVIVKCDGCAYDVDVDVDVEGSGESTHLHRLTLAFVTVPNSRVLPQMAIFVLFRPG